MSTHAGNPGSNGAAKRPTMRCVICHPATADLPGELLSSLSRRMGRITICTNIYAALAECCLIERTAGDAQAGSMGVLVLVHPRHMPHGDAVRLVEAARRYAPSIGLWQYDRGANPKLRGIVEEHVASSFALIPPTPAPPAPATPLSPRAAVVHPTPPIVQTRPVSDFAPKQLNGDHGPLQMPARPAARAASMLTEDELRMLLGNENNDEIDLGPLPFRPPQGSPRAPGKGGGT